MLFHLAHPTCYSKLHFGVELALFFCKNKELRWWCVKVFKESVKNSDKNTSGRVLFNPCKYAFGIWSFQG